MSFKFTRFNLLNKVKDNIIKPLILSDTAYSKYKDITWYNLTQFLNKAARDFYSDKDTRFNWFNIIPKLQEFYADIQTPLGFVDLTSSDWGTLTTVSAWESKFLSEGANYAIITNFSLVAGRVQFNISTDLEYFRTFSKNITQFGAISNINTLKLIYLNNNPITTFNPTLPLPNGLEGLQLDDTQITVFNPTIPLPITLKNLYLRRTLQNTASWNTQTAWIANVPNNGTLYAFGNTSTVTGTNTATLLLAKNWTIVA